MTYFDNIVGLCQQLGYRDKLRLAQLLIQLARKEEEQQNPEKRVEQSQKKEKEQNPEKRVEQSQPASPSSKNSSETIQYVIERLKKIRPGKKRSLLNSINAMFQFQGGISDADKEKIISELQRLKHIKIDKNSKVTYL